MRVGIGFDAHKFTSNRPLVLGGVHIPFPLGLEGYSDADVVIHAIIDAILGAISEGDMGLHFPDTEERYRDISSLTLLSEVKKILTERRYKVVNLDVVVALEEPKIAPFRDEMKGKIAHTLDIERDRVNVKATTTEGLGFTGRREGIAAYAVALVEQI
ncbi:MAG: 2-C-methyl-D-erythritol 2,4-cyclodiphosphate synthase [Actinomycetota bacterium]|nr:2-C-methyl-D-erythritol 2,4-cyclodiphosphate synthase [Actinomycetota bacterium]